MSLRRCAFTLIELLVVMAIILVLFGLFGSFLFEGPLRLGFGWASFLVRNLGQLTVSTVGLMTFGLLAAAIVACIMWVSRGLFGSEPKIHLRSAVAITTGIIALFGAGLGAAGVAHQISWLIRSPEPLLQSTSVAAYRMRDSNRLKSVAAGFQQRHSERQDVVDRPFDELTLRSDDGTLLHGWQTQCLPFISQQELYESIDLAKPWNSKANAAPLSTVIPPYLRWDRRTPDVPKMHGSYALSHLAINALLLGDGSIGRFDDITDGLSSTVLFGSARGQFLPWGHPQNWRSGKYRPNEDDRGFGSHFQGGCHMGMADGAVIFIIDSIDPELWKALFTPNAGEEIEDQVY